MNYGSVLFMENIISTTAPSAQKYRLENARRIVSRHSTLEAACRAFHKARRLDPGNPHFISRLVQARGEDGSLAIVWDRL